MPKQPTPDQAAAVAYMRHYLQRRGKGNMTVEIVDIAEIEREHKFASQSAQPARLSGPRTGYHDTPQLRLQTAQPTPELEYRMAADDADITEMQTSPSTKPVRGA